jgi:hypothetical protein
VRSALLDECGEQFREAGLTKDEYGLYESAMMSSVQGDTANPPDVRPIHCMALRESPEKTERFRQFVSPLLELRRWALQCPRRRW